LRHVTQQGEDPHAYSESVPIIVVVWRLPCFGLGIILFFCTQFADARAQNSSSVRQAESLSAQGRLAEAERSWQAITTLDTNNARAWAQLGLVEAREANYPAAVEAYQRALKLSPGIPDLQLDLGLALFKQGKFAEAIGPLRAAAAAAPKDSSPQILLGMSYYGTEQFTNAVPYLQFAVKHSPENVELRSVLAQSCLYAKVYECTLEQYREIVASNPDSAQAHMLAGEALDGLERTNEAIEEFQAAAKAAPAEPGLHFGLGYLLWKQNRIDEAEREFRLQLQSDPNDGQALAYLGDIAIKRGNRGDAETILSRAVTVPGTVRLAWLDLGILSADKRQGEEAAADFRRAIEMDPTQADAHWRLARLYQSMGRAQEAKTEFAKVKELHQHSDNHLVEQMSRPPGSAQ
jgi:tetratricopeptide (TPR) repeat protein